MFSIPLEKYTIYTYRIKHIGVGEGQGGAQILEKIFGQMEKNAGILIIFRANIN